MHLLSPFSLNLPLYEHKKRPSYINDVHLIYSRGARVQKCQKKAFRYVPFLAEFSLVYPLVHSIGSMKPDIALNLSLANIPVTVCLIRYPSFS